MGGVSSGLTKATAPPPLVTYESGDIYQKKSSDPSTTALDDQRDWRVRISATPSSRSRLYSIMGSVGTRLVTKADGVIFPYTPQMTVNYLARYSEMALTHSNYKGYFYDGSEIGAISLSGLFTAQNEKEALYVQSAIQFLRACTKMHFGSSDALAGTPPPLVRLSGYGDFYMPSVTCVITQFSHTMPEDVDYVPFAVGDKLGGRVPASSTIQVTLQPVVSRTRQTQSFSLDKFQNGQYIARRDDITGGLL
jgi:hypothetical protein